MISIEKLIQNISQCKDTNITLPTKPEWINFIQKTALDIRKDELENIDTTLNQLTDANYTMDKEIELHAQQVSHPAQQVSHPAKQVSHPSHPSHPAQKVVYPEQNVKSLLGIALDSVVIASKSLIVCNENETSQLPEILLELLCNGGVDSKEWYLYGVKNPESFYKSFMFLIKMDFIIKNKTEKKNEVATFKRELALQYETFYKALDYRKLHFPHFEMVNQLTNIDNYAEYDALKYIVDYTQTNLVILDIINSKYLDISFTPNNIFQHNSKGDLTTCVIVIKYSNNTYIPLMNSTISHKFNISILDTIKKYFERIFIDKFKEPVSSNESSEIITLDKPEVEDTTKLKPLAKYNLLDLQMLAQLHKLDSRKQGTSGKKINKTKQEIYDELQNIMI